MSTTSNHLLEANPGSYIKHPGSSDVHTPSNACAHTYAGASGLKACCFWDVACPFLLPPSAVVLVPHSSPDS